HLHRRPPGHPARPDHPRARGRPHARRALLVAAQGGTGRPLTSGTSGKSSRSRRDAAASTLVLMEWVVLLLALALVVGLAVVRARRADRPDRALPQRAARSRKPRGDEPALTPDDEAELARGFAAAEHDDSHILDALLD